MKGQIEISFQWVFALIAGGVLLFILLFAVRSCSQQSDARLATSSVQRSAAAISEAAWYAQTNFTAQFPPVSVTCPATTLTVEENGVRASIDPVPAFLPARLGDATQIATRTNEVPGVLPIRLGNVLYAIDDSSYYLVLSDSLMNYRRVLPMVGRRGREVTDAQLPSSLEALPRGVDVIVVSFAPARTVAPGDKSVLWVEVDDVRQMITFRRVQQDGSLSLLGTEYFVGDSLLLGAVIAGQPSTYRCARDNLVRRDRYLLSAMHGRSQVLAQTHPSAFCRDRLQAASQELLLINASSDAQMLQQLTIRGTLSSIQQSLYEGACPVIG